jgi:hypothetical protein
MSRDIEVVRALSAVSLKMWPVDETWSGLFTLRDHKVIRIEAFTNRDEAVRAAVSSTRPEGRSE